ncbi:STAS domain-containing protein [Actinomadura formosensis]|uniref:STAS domain-containing protein n=1 Tax=Actinomadura formosensis TaxID=60706 RepID=UPI000AEA5F9B|nr:STAS domain-containing protein [Actinomadura formosensis]
MTSADDRPARPASPGARAPSIPSPAGGVTCAGGTLRLAIGAQQDGATMEVRLNGELDMASSDDLRHHIGAVIAAHDPHRLLLDLSELSFADSSGLAVLVWAHQAMSRRGRQLRLHHPQTRVLRVLHVSGLHTRLHITEANIGESPGSAGPNRGRRPR